jgi:hypothetical protein
MSKGPPASRYHPLSKRARGLDTRFAARSGRRSPQSRPRPSSVDRVSVAPHNSRQRRAEPQRTGPALNQNPGPPQDRRRSATTQNTPPEHRAPIDRSGAVQLRARLNVRPMARVSAGSATEPAPGPKTHPHIDLRHCHPCAVPQQATFTSTASVATALTVPQADPLAGPTPGVHRWACGNHRRTGKRRLRRSLSPARERQRSSPYSREGVSRNR